MKKLIQTKQTLIFHARVNITGKMSSSSVNKDKQNKENTKKIIQEPPAVIGIIQFLQLTEHTINK